MKNNNLPEVPELAKVSSKGQLVIPLDLRKKLNVKQGSMFAVSNPVEDLLVLKKIDSKITQKELEILGDIRDAWDEIENGDSEKFTKGKFLKNIEKW